MNYLNEFATEYRITLGNASIILRKLPKSDRVHFTKNGIEYTTSTTNGLPDDSVITFDERQSSDMWLSSVSMNGIQGYALPEANFLNWTSKNLPYFVQLVNDAGGLFLTAELALEAAQSLIDKIEHSDLESVKKDLLQITKHLVKSTVTRRNKLLKLKIPDAPDDLTKDYEYTDGELSSFYFVAHPSGNRSQVTVIDLSFACDYERNDWSAVNGYNFYTAPAAIKFAKEIARINGIAYMPFHSRYGSEFDETKK